MRGQAGFHHVGWRYEITVRRIYGFPSHIPHGSRCCHFGYSFDPESWGQSNDTSSLDFALAIVLSGRRDKRVRSRIIFVKPGSLQ